ncbi:MULTISPECIES: DUF1304 domain-containing protein [unclassified Streptococcus]|uniref:DUF1304 domain-containing protein n=1 Tax=unclassified Streptococcus TaxID=2608887 RepID=UPI0011B81DA5|nr:MULTISPECIES: DUF1304 family protein [unclassified Streptococcus]TWS95607.1 DUF1304 family protein [Streptococcus sp. sy018]TWT16727.1 DUF1304 family protein [Streptococcus sp. sy010]
MSIIANFFVVLVALECFYIMYLETVITSSAKTAKVFGMSQEELKQKSLNTLFKNQGIYNGLLGVGLLYGLLFNVSFVPAILIYIILVASYGALTSSPKIILTQGGPAILALILTIFA